MHTQFCQGNWLDDQEGDEKISLGWSYADGLLFGRQMEPDSIACSYILNFGGLSVS
jgi:hypothetical protein